MASMPFPASWEHQFHYLVPAATEPPPLGCNQNAWPAGMQAPPSTVLSRNVCLERPLSEHDQLPLPAPSAMNPLPSMSERRDRIDLPLPCEHAQGIACLHGIEMAASGMNEAWRARNDLLSVVASAAQQCHWDPSSLASTPESAEGAATFLPFFQDVRPSLSEERKPSWPDALAELREAQITQQTPFLSHETTREPARNHQPTASEMTAHNLHYRVTDERSPSSAQGINDHGSISTLKKRKTISAKGSSSSLQLGSMHALEDLVEVGNGRRLKNAKGSEGNQNHGTKPSAKKEQSCASGSSTTSCEMEVDKNESQIKRPSEARESPKQDYIHVRARRGQATDSHSLAERVRREKISERMKLLQSLVPNCNKVSGKAMVLDEIINYVQSLQHQVEFLSMRLVACSPTLEYFENSLNPTEFISTIGPTNNWRIIPVPEISSLSGRHCLVVADEFRDAAAINDDQIPVGTTTTTGLMSTYLGW